MPCRTGMRAANPKSDRSLIYEADLNPALRRPFNDDASLVQHHLKQRKSRIVSAPSHRYVTTIASFLTGLNSRRRSRNLRDARGVFGNDGEAPSAHLTWSHVVPQCLAELPSRAEHVCFYSRYRNTHVLSRLLDR